MSDFSFAPSISPTAASRWAPIFARLAPPETLDAATSRTAEFALFAGFGPRFDAVFAETSLEDADVAPAAFDRFGFSTRERFAAAPEAVALPDDARRTPVSVESISFAVANDARLLVAAPTATFRLIFAAALGFDVRRVLRDAASERDFAVEAGRPTTPLERAAFRSERARFASFAPFPSLARSSNVADENAPPLSPPPDLTTGVDRRFLAADALFYWERRRFELAGRTFYWAFAFPAKVLEPAVRSVAAKSPFPLGEPRRSDADSNRVAVDASVVPSPRRSSVDSPTFSASGPSYLTPSSPVAAAERTNEPRKPASAAFESANESPEPSKTTTADTTIELSVEIARGELSLDDWRALRPGDVLPLDVPANARFVACLDGVPKFLGRPGLRRGVPAIQLERPVPADFFVPNATSDSATARPNRKK